MKNEFEKKKKMQVFIQSCTFIMVVHTSLLRSMIRIVLLSLKDTYLAIVRQSQKFNYFGQFLPQALQMIIMIKA